MKHPGLGQGAVPAKCDTALEFADGRMIMPDDTLTLEDMCHAVPALFEAFWTARAGAKRPSPGILALPGQGVAGAIGGGGTAFPSGGGMGPKGSTGNPGPAGAPGPAGPSGSGFNADFVVITDPILFLPEPDDGTLQPLTQTGSGLTAHVQWNQAASGKVIILANLIPGSRAAGPLASSESLGQIGVRVDGVDHGLASNDGSPMPPTKRIISLHSSIALDLPAGSHEVILVARRLGGAFTVTPFPTSPIVLTVIHP
jgi:hypothetical protein